MAAKKFKYFQNEDVNVRFLKPTSIIVAQRGALPIPIPKPTAASKFKPIRTLMNLELVDVTQPKTKKLTLVPPVELVVGYNKSDLKKAGNRELCLGYWDDKLKDWIPLTKLENISRVEPLNPKKNRGLIKVYIHVWGDPPISIGT